MSAKPRLNVLRPSPPETATGQAADAPASPSPLPRQMVRSKGAASVCGVSLATWHRLDAAGLVPQAIRLGGAKLYRLDELTAWVRHGCFETLLGMSRARSLARESPWEVFLGHRDREKLARDSGATSMFSGCHD